MAAAVHFTISEPRKLSTFCGRQDLKLRIVWSSSVHAFRKKLATFLRYIYFAFIIGKYKIKTINSCRAHAFLRESLHEGLFSEQKLSDFSTYGP